MGSRVVRLLGIENWELRIENSTFYILHSKFSFSWESLGGRVATS